MFASDKKKYLTKIIRWYNLSKAVDFTVTRSLSGLRRRVLTLQYTEVWYRYPCVSQPPETHSAYSLVCYQ